MTEQALTTSAGAKMPALNMTEAELVKVLQTSLYPGAAIESIKMVIGYCKAAGLDPMQKPVHIVPMWDGKTKQMRDVVMPGIGLYRTQAARTNQYLGMTEPEFGPTVEANIGGVTIRYPEWCRVTARRRLDSGDVAEFPVREFWLENYAVKGGQEKSIAPNAMWQRRPFAQLAKCARAQALREAFPELGAQPTAEEMEGREIDAPAVQRRQTGAEIAAAAMAKRQPDDNEQRQALVEALENVAAQHGIDAYAAAWTDLTKEQRAMVGADEHKRLKELASRANVIEGQAEDVPQ